MGTPGILASECLRAVLFVQAVIVIRQSVLPLNTDDARASWDCRDRPTWHKLQWKTKWQIVRVAMMSRVPPTTTGTMMWVVVSN